MFVNPIIGMIHNTAKGTYHPALFTESPLPGPPAADKPIRWKSRMHHTAGFPTRDAAVLDIESNMVAAVKEQSIGEPRRALGKDFAWDGEGIPVMVVFFAEVNGELVPVM